MLSRDKIKNRVSLFREQSVQDVIQENGSRRVLLKGRINPGVWYVRAPSQAGPIGECYGLAVVSKDVARNLSAAASSTNLPGNSSVCGKPTFNNLC